VHFKCSNQAINSLSRIAPQSMRSILYNFTVQCQIILPRLTADNFTLSNRINSSQHWKRKRNGEWLQDGRGIFTGERKNRRGSRTSIMI
jgi:hypothetical protein